MHRRHCHWNQRPELYHRDIYTDELCALFLPQQRSRGLQPPKSRSWTILLLWWHLIACDRGVLLSRGSFGHGSNQRSQYVHIPLDTDIHSYMAEMYGKGVFGEMHDLHLFTDPGSRTAFTHVELLCIAGSMLRDRSTLLHRDHTLCLVWVLYTGDDDKPAIIRLHSDHKHYSYHQHEHCISNRSSPATSWHYRLTASRE